LKIGLKYEYLDDIENFLKFPFPISNYDAIKNIKYISKEIILKCFKITLNNYNFWNFKKSII